MSVDHVLLEVVDGTLLLRSVGTYTIDDLGDVHAQALLLTRDLPSFSILVEDPDGHFVPPADLGDLQEIRACLESFGTRLTCTAVVVSDDLHYGIARAVAAYEQIGGGRMRVFRDIEAARMWLSVEARGGGSETTH